MGLVAFWATWGAEAGLDRGFPYVLHGLLITAFGGTGALLLFGGRGDRRAVNLGAFFLATSTAWANKPLRLFAHGDPGLGLFSLADALELDAFMAFFLWRFVRDFPAPMSSLAGRRRTQQIIGLCAAAGLALFVLNLLLYAARQVPGGFALAEALGLFAPQRGQGLYYAVALALATGAFAVLLWRAHTAQRDDQRRARAFLLVLALSFGPMIAMILFELLIPGAYARLLGRRPGLKGEILLGTLLPALSLPITVPYAVLVHRVLDVRLMARRAFQYLLARYTVLTLVAVPLAGIAVYLYFRRGQSLAAVFSGGRLLLLVSAAAVGIAALRYRKPLLDAVDRRFFREQYDARQILSLLVDRIRSIRHADELAQLLTREVDLALHLDGTALLVLDPRSGMISDPRSRARKLDGSSPLAHLVASTSAALEVDLENPHSPLLKLPEKDRRWLAESGFRLIVPVLSRDGSLLGLLGLGEKKSRLSFLREDRQLLHAIASSAAWVLELELESSLTSTVTPAPRLPARDPRGLDEDDPTPSLLLPGPAPGAGAAPVLELAKECAKCGAVHPSYTVFCSSCSKRLETSRVPYVLPGKFRFEQRIGVGGMGIVYRGADLVLGRHVAIKTLRQVSSADAIRLRHEARTAAAVAHPHLAPIFGMETWRGAPMLVMELLEGGTLAQRLARGNTLAPREAVDLGLAMAGALAQLHEESILHRDLKPSNIGYTRDGVPKLMDFGIARLMFDLRREEALAQLEGETAGDGDDGDDDTDLDSLEDLIPAAAVWTELGDSDLPPRRRFAGTLSYLSPEALAGDPADETFDLWGLSLVLYEGLLGRKVFLGTDQQVVERIQSSGVPDFALACPEHPAVLGEFFREALHRSPGRRPATARELLRRLEAVRL